MDTNLLLMISAVSGIFVLLGGLLITKGKKSNIQVNQPTVENLSEVTDNKEIEVDTAPEANKPDDDKFGVEDTDLLDTGLIDQLEAEIEILRSEAVIKDRELEKITQNSTRLGTRILELEDSLKQKESQIIENVISTEKEQKTEVIKEGMDSFMDALQKESDTLRSELENAYRMINSQERELSRFKGDSGEEFLETNELYRQIELLQEELELKNTENKDLIEALKNSNLNADANDLKVNVNLADKRNIPKKSILGKASPLPKKKDTSPSPKGKVDVDRLSSVKSKAKSKPAGKSVQKTSSGKGLPASSNPQAEALKQLLNGNVTSPMRKTTKVELFPSDEESEEISVTDNAEQKIKPLSKTPLGNSVLDKSNKHQKKSYKTGQVKTLAPTAGTMPLGKEPPPKA